MKELKQGDRVVVSGDKQSFFQFHKHCPKGHLGLKIKTCEVLISSSDDFTVARVATFPLRVVKLLK